MPRKSAAGRRSRASGTSEPILRDAEESWSGVSGAPAPMPAGKAAGSGNGVNGGTPARSSSKARAVGFLSALRWRPRLNVLAVVYEKVVYHVMWLVESVVVVGRLVFFLMRFGFKQL
ncbi:hypothetical protein TRIUR3_16380 [Triticum urartu]|uniref:Uncharacterized protein n=2 Tax=Triticum urartu TaxID=4572 RepID=M8A447_TRIUA|nr:hypothetical protein TRIUR3_16380 [Triticum urartu]